MESEKEYQLVEKSKNDIRAFDELYRHYLPQIFGYCYNRIPNRTIVEDIVSDVFVSVVERIGKFEFKKGATFGSWIYRIAHNKIVDYFRKYKTLPLDESNEISEIQDNDKELQNNQNKIRIAKVLAEIKPRYQEIISLKYYSELSNSEIAEIVGSDNVSVILHRALKSFKDKYHKLYPKSEIFDVI
jgi:RNA polymerase sigma-70 factor, ECF subfamily